MNFEIRNDIPHPSGGTSKPGNIRYTLLPLRKMKVGECIILFKCKNKRDLCSKQSTASVGIRRAAAVLGMEGKLQVSRTSDNMIGVWRIK